MAAPYSLLHAWRARGEGKSRTQHMQQAAGGRCERCGGGKLGAPPADETASAGLAIQALKWQ